MSDPENKEPKSMIDNLFDMAEQFVGGVENLAGYKEGVWKVEEVIDNDTGAETFEVTDRIRSFSTTNKDHAEWLVAALSGVKK